MEKESLHFAALLSLNNIKEILVETAIQMFKFENKQEIRIVQREDGEPLFVAADVCGILGIANTGDAVRRLDEDQKDVASIYTLGGNQKMIVITESGLYDLTMRSDKPNAKLFRKWVTSEVLPSIRKTGSYSIEKQSPARQALAMAQALVSLEDRVEAIESRQREAEKQMFALPEPTVPAPEKTLRAALNECARSYSSIKSVSQVSVWNWLYKELKYRKHFDVKAHNLGKGQNYLDLVEEHGLLPEFYAIAREVLV